jgi:hypothetical protein
MRRSTNRRSRTSWLTGSRGMATTAGVLAAEVNIQSRLHSAGHLVSGTASFRACDSRDFTNSTARRIKIPPTIAVLVVAPVQIVSTVLIHNCLRWRDGG